MAKQGMNKGVKIALILATIGVLGVGGYFLYKKLKKKQEEKEEEKKSEKRSAVTEQQVKTTDYNRRSNPSSSTLGKTPFKNTTEGNAFRKWINDTYPKYAKKISLDPTGSYDNAYIRKAWNEYGVEYKEANKNKGAVYTATYGQKFADLLKKWKKSHLLSVRDATKDVPYFQLFLKPFKAYLLGKNACLIGINVYDRKKGENVGGTNNQGYFTIMTKTKGKWSVKASGRWDNDLTTLKVLSGMKKGQTYSGGKEVGSKIGKILDLPDATWC